MTDELDNEIEIARRQLKDDLEKREKEAQQSIDKILSREGMEFCSRCNRKVDDRSEWLGRCLHRVCTNLICNYCWVSENKRYCSEHFEEIAGPEKNGKKKTVFKPQATETQETIPVPQEEDDKEKITTLMNNYAEFIKERLSGWPPDWNTEGWIENPKIKFASSRSGAEITICSKRFLSKKGKIKFTIRPVYGRAQQDIDFALSAIKEEPGIYHILVLVGNECDAKALEYIDSFNKPTASLFLVEPAKRLVYMDEKPVTKLYSAWIDTSKAPQRLKDFLRSLVKEKVSGKDVLTEKPVSEKFGFTEEQTLGFLGSCKFLKHVEGTDTFYFVG